MKSARLFSRDGLLVTVFTLISALSWSNTSLAASLVLNWKDTSSNETGFKVERALGTTGSFSQIASVGANMQSYTDSSISGGNTYCYRVRAYNSTGSSSPSNSACVNVTGSSGSRVGGSGNGSTSGSSGGSTSPSSGGSVIPISTSTTIEKQDIPWTNYRFKVKLKSTDNDAIGVMFRYQDEITTTVLYGIRKKVRAAWRNGSTASFTHSAKTPCRTSKDKHTSWKSSQLGKI